MLARVAALAALGGFLFGYDLGLIGGAMLGISQTFNITSNATKQAIVGAAKLGAFFGTFLGGVLMLRYGRRLAIAAEAVFFVLGPVIMATAVGPGGLVIGRLIVGLGVGASAIVVPAYLAEIAPAAKRGAVVQTYEMMLTLGMLCAGVIDWLLSRSNNHQTAWRWMVGIPAAPGALLLLSLSLLPESPRWLVLRGNLDLALKILHDIIQSNSSSGSGGAGSGGAAALPAISAAESQALAKAEDELLLLWSSVQKEQAATVLLRQQRQQQPEAAAAPQGIASAHENGSSAQQQLQQVVSKHQSNTFVDPAPAAAAAAAGGGVYTLDGEEDVPDNTPSAGPGNCEQQRTDALGAGRATAKVDEKQQQEPAGMQKANADEVGSSQHVQQQQQQQWVAAADDNQSQQLLSQQHISSSSSCYNNDTDVYQDSARQHGIGSWKTGGLGLWLRGWLRRRKSRLHSSTSSNAVIPTAAGSSSRSLQCEPGHEPNVLYSLVAMLYDIVTIAKGPERAAFAIAASLAVFNQATASTSVINYAPEVLDSVLGVSDQGSAILLSAAITLTKCVGVGTAFMVVDAWGRKPLLIWGGAGCGAALLLVGLAIAISNLTLFLTCLCLFIFSFSVSWAGLYWVVVSEIFSMGAKSPATSAATSLLFLTGSIIDFLFLSLVNWLGAGAFGLFAAVAFGSAWYVYRSVPETKGRTLVEIQAMLAAPAAAAAAAGDHDRDHQDRDPHDLLSDQISDRDGVIRYGRWRGWDWGRTTRPAAAAAAAAAGLIRTRAMSTDQAGESIPLQQQEQQQLGDAAAAAVPGGQMTVGDDVDGGQYWQQWIQRQQQQHSSSNGMTLPLGRELRSVGGSSGGRSRHGGGDDDV